MPGATWSGENTILFSPDVSAGTVLWRVSSDGGKPEPLTSLVEGEQVHAWPQVLPGGKAVLYTSNHVSSAFNEAQIVVQSLQSGARRVVHNGGFHGRYLNSGHLVYIHDGTLFAAAFDLDRLELAGKPVAVLPGVASNAANGGAQFSVSDNGMLAYLPGRAEGLARSLQFMDRDGKTTPVRSAPMNWLNLVFARDGRRLAMEILGESSDIWVYELARDTMTRVTSHPAEDTRPVWTPNDRRIVFASSRAGKSVMNLYWQRSDGTGEAERLTDSPYNQRPNSFHPSGRFLAFDEASANRYDVMILPLDGDDASRWTPGTPRPLLDGPSSRLDPMFSPDGRWIAYASDQSGVIEVHVAPFPGPGRTVQMSLGGGGTPTWSRTKQELFYEADGQIKVVRYSVAGKEIRAAKPELWSESRHEGDMTSRAFDLHPDGARFVLSPTTRGPGGAKVDKVVFVSNFFDELRRVAP
jgi:serine/threonine-protein kinase